MRWVLSFGAVFLSGCSASPAKDACSLLDKDAVQSVMNSQIVSQELDPGIDNGKVVGSACLITFADGVFAKVSVEQFLDKSFEADFHNKYWKLNRGSRDEEMSKALRIPTYFDNRGQVLSADLPNLAFLHIYLKQRNDKGKATDSVEDDAYVVRFKRPKVKDGRRKAEELARLVKF